MEIALRRDRWAELNHDLQDEIVQRIDSYGDYIRFRVTCKIWYEELPKIPKHIKLPLLLLPFDNEGDNLRPFFHPGEKRVIYHLPLPETRNTLLRGSRYGWLITVGLDDTVRMLNPITRAQIHLPPLSTLPTVVDYRPHKYGKEYVLSWRDGLTYTLEKWTMQRAFIHKVIISSPPDDDDQDFMAIAIAMCGGNKNLCYCRRGDKTWTRLTDFSGMSFDDAIFHEGKIYAVDAQGFIYEYDMKTAVGGLRRRPSGYKYLCDTYAYLVQSSVGLLLVIKIIEEEESEGEAEGDGDAEGEGDEEGDGDAESEGDTESDGGYLYYETTGFKVFKLDESQNRWLRVKDLNDHVLVLGFNYSTCVLPHTISSNKGNRIYYSDDVWDFQSKLSGGHDNGVFDLENEAIHKFFPDFGLILPAPIWLL